MVRSGTPQNDEYYKMMNYYTNMVLPPFIFLFLSKRGQEIRGGKHFKCLPPLIYTVLKYPAIWLVTIIFNTWGPDSNLSLNASAAVLNIGTIGTTDPNIVGVEIGPRALRGSGRV